MNGKIYIQGLSTNVLNTGDATIYRYISTYRDALGSDTILIHN